MIRLGSEEDFKGKTNEFEINELLNNINYSNKDKFEIAKMLFSSKDLINSSVFSLVELATIFPSL